MLAVDIGATKLAAGLVGADGAVYAHDRMPTPAGCGAALDALLAMGRALVDKAGHEGIAIGATGIACGGPLDLENGLVLSPPNLPDWDQVPICAIMADAFGHTAFLQNDAAAGVIATYLWDNPGHCVDIVYITVSSGVGCGVISNGALYVGSHGNGSELGHIPLIWDGRPCRCGQTGCIEAYVSGTSIGERFTEHCRAFDPRSSDVFSAEQVARMAAAGDARAVAFWAESMRMLRRATQASIDLFDPAFVTLGGGVTEAGDELMQHVFAPAGYNGALSARTGKLAPVRRTGFGRNSGVTSAAAVAWNEIDQGSRPKVKIR